ncbi:Hypothetical predicted protein [Mytilus galloprovincialis]|uniref:Uncharacterized protein n=1 Tax=Mytilus galloprovincialis TaxID=29158 RepID=A0A8B6DD43_MYTGA|nr:Hypothetical predicted protein [Mytilus galloprovincialis]
MSTSSGFVVALNHDTSDKIIMTRNLKFQTNFSSSSLRVLNWYFRSYPEEIDEKSYDSEEEELSSDYTKMYNDSSDEEDE